MSSYIGTFFMWNQISLFHFHLTWKTVSISLCNLPGSCVYLMEPAGTGQVNVTCPVSSTLSWSAEFKHRNISAHAVHIWGDWQHLKGHWEKAKIPSCSWLFDSIKCRFSAIKDPFTRNFRIIVRFEAFICCYCDQEDDDCVGVHILLTLFCSEFSHEMSFCGEFSKYSSWEAGVLEVNCAGSWWWKG
jgi:hypothetical protein